MIIQLTNMKRKHMLVKSNDFLANLYQRDNKSQMQPDLSNVLNLFHIPAVCFVLFMNIALNRNLGEVKKYPSKQS